MHTRKELEMHQVEKRRLSCDSGAPQVESAQSDSTRFGKMNHRKTNRCKMRPNCSWFKIVGSFDTKFDHIISVLFFWYHYLSSQDLYCVRSDLGNLLKALGRLDEAKVRTNLCYSLLSPWPYEYCRFVKIMIMKTIPVFPNMLSLLGSIF